MNLYQATELARLESHIDDETGEIDIASFDAAQITLADKQRAVVAYVRNLDSNETMLADAIKQLQAKQKAMKAKRERLSDYLLENMKAANITKIEAIDGTFSATLYPERDVSVVIEDGATFPPEFCNAPKPPEPSKTKIKAAIEAGQAIAGACIVKNDRLTIK
jgi:Siphovirus Gp157